MKKSLILLIILVGYGAFAHAQGPTQCLYSGVWTSCSLVANAQLAQTMNTKVSGGAGTTITNAFGSNTSAGNAIVCMSAESAAAAPVITDAQTNSYAVVTSGTTAPGYSISAAQNIVGLTTDTITSTTTSGAAAFQCAEVKGAAYTGQPWGAFNAQQGTGATITFAPISAGAGDMVMLAVGLGAGTVNATPALMGNNTTLVTVDNSNTAVTGGAALSVWYTAHTYLSEAKTYTQTVSLNASQTYTAMLVVIKASKLPVSIANPISSPASVAILPAQGFTTYAASKLGLVPASSPTDIAVLSGNATNTVIPTYVSMACTQTTAGIIDVQLEIRTTADTSGTSTGSPTSFPLDQNNAAAVSSVLTYTANPTVNDGTNRIIDTQKLGAMAAATAVPSDIYVWRPNIGQSVVLRGTAQQLAINLNAVTLTGGSCDITYRWIETTGL